ncbi:MAG: hypothetical protein ACYCOU_06130 [Sulfobacillus sp.]
MAAVNRYYYAAYQSAVAILKERGPGQPDAPRGEAGWRHGQVADALADTLNDESVGAGYEFLYDQRRRADYFLDSLSDKIVQEVKQEAERLIGMLETAL